MSNEEISIDTLEIWVRNRFEDITLTEQKYPVSYGIFGFDRESQNKRMAELIDAYSKKTTPELEGAKKRLTEKKKRLCRQIYQMASYALERAKQALSKNRFDDFKDKIILWILAKTKHQNTYSFGMIENLNSSSFEGLQPMIAKDLERLKQMRLEWVILYERINVINQIISAKDETKELKFIALEAFVYSDKYSSQLTSENFKFSDKRKKHGEKEAIKEFWNKNKGDYLTDDYKFNSSGYYNKNKIAKQVQEDGGFTSHPDTIKDHANLGDLQN